MIALSNPAILGIVGGIASVVITAVVIAFVLKRARVGAAWKAYAALNGFEYKPGGAGTPELRGNLKHVPVLVGVQFRYVGQNRVYHTVVTTWLNVPLPLALMSQDRANYGGAPAESPLALNLPAIGQFVVWSNNPPRAKAVLSESACKLLKGLVDRYPLVTVLGDQVVLELPGVLETVEDVENMVEDTVRLNQVIAKAARAIIPR